MRIPITPEADRSPAQQEVVRTIIEGPRGRFGGPLLPMIENPKVAMAAQELGRVLRFDGALPPALRELATLVVSRHANGQLEFFSHATQARDLGVDEAVIEAIRKGRRPDALSPEQAAIHDAAQALLTSYTLTEDLLASVQAAVGVDGLIELTALCAYYGFMAMLLNVAEVPMPPGVEPPLPAL